MLIAPTVLPTGSMSEISVAAWAVCPDPFSSVGSQLVSS
jgi:hypothetical protein